LSLAVIPARSSSFSLPCHRLRRIPLVSLHLLAIVLAFDISCPSWSPAFIFVLGLRHPRVRPSLRQLYSISSSIIITATLLPLPSPSLSSPSPLRGHTRRRVRQSTSVGIHPYRPASLDPVVNTREFGTHTKALRSIDSRSCCSRPFDRLQYARAAAHSWVSLRTELGGISQVVTYGRYRRGCKRCQTFSWADELVSFFFFLFEHLLV
jgi:hypothetical protein